jgi:hypothetical protein
VKTVPKNGSILGNFRNIQVAVKNISGHTGPKAAGQQILGLRKLDFEEAITFVRKGKYFSTEKLSKFGVDILLINIGMLLSQCMYQHTYIGTYQRLSFSSALHFF